MTISKVEDQKIQPKEKEKKNIIKVVAQLPMQPVRMVEDEECVYHYITVEEYLTSQANVGSA